MVYVYVTIKEMFTINALTVKQKYFSQSRKLIFRGEEDEEKGNLRANNLIFILFL